MVKETSKNTIAILLVLALIFAGIGVGIAINNYQSIDTAAYKEVSTTTEPSVSQGQVGVLVVPAEEEGING